MKCNKSLGSLGAALLASTMAVVLVPGAWGQSKFKTLHSFSVGKGGDVPGGLIFDAAGNLYGTAGSGAKGGAAFKLTANQDGSWTESVLYAFCSLTNCADGSGPRASLIFDKAGNLYGTTWAGGATNNGTVFKLTTNGNGSWTESVLYSFAGGNDGTNPTGLIFDQAGNLYGTTNYGGSANDSGTVFKLASNGDGSWKEIVLHRFRGFSRDGSNPTAGLIFDQAGNLYGTTNEGGGKEAGTVFMLTPDTDGRWKESILHRFCSRTKCHDGLGPYAGLIFDQAGNLYGTTSGGGVAGAGTVFKLTPSTDGSWTESVLYNFAGGNDGGTIFAGLIFDQTGNLFGTAYYGGDAGYGVVYKLAPTSSGGWRETVLHSFVDRPGAMPFAGVTFDAVGNLYGATGGDFVKTHGSVFEITQ
jgi:uncharacterized repeat protein (TIGR03803 family)